MIVPDGLEDYRPNVGVCLLNRQGLVWLGTRAGVGENEPLTAYRWQMPQGGIDEGEAPDLAAFRELREETGVTSARLLTMTPGWLAYDFPAEYRKKRWRGQRQKWAVMLFEGEDDEVDLDADEHKEFDDWRWAELSEAAGLVVPFKRGVYEELAASIAPLAAFVAARG
ncbi:RNA pyrophosphohydrolase [Parvularcula dongshanensis]|uniref:RNA pyrophosphohydrolase n=1 Tax=Parvularcula dongshanensis TaxID=1173995 RepID=A0A840I204_9PROT|nr:RNA pyrophosphohydrolase [Parvularcula dongshanensis]MBB4658313.1 putative (di)nucleoside polyphosphate hydrolase [Parvularcula dongshanensis]